MLAFDAFARCWVQEDALFDRIGAVIEGGRPRAAMPALRAAWRTRNRLVFEQSMAVLARQLATTALDREQAPSRGAGAAALAWIGQLAGGELHDATLDRTMAVLAERADAAVANPPTS